MSNLKNTTMKAYCLFFIFLFSISSLLVSCDTTPLNENVIQQEEPKFSISKGENFEAIKQLFSSHTSQTRSLESGTLLDEYDFTKSMTANFSDKQEKLYLIPSTKKDNELLAGISLDNEIVYLLKLSKTSENIYTLYNETNEPICDVKYDSKKQNIVIISNYGNDAIATPTTRGRWYSFACNIGIGTAAAAAGALAAPTMGASVGMVVCTALVQMLIC